MATDRPDREAAAAPSWQTQLTNPTNTTRTPAKKAAPKPAKKTTPKKTAAKPSSTSVPANGEFTVDTFLAALRSQESGDYKAHTGKPGFSASGAYQYVDSTWNHFGGYAHAWQAPPEVQDQRARQDVEGRLKAYGGDWRKVAAAHFAGGGWVAAHPDPATWGVNPVPGSQNPTVSAYVNSLFGKAGATPKGVSPSTGGNPTVTPHASAGDVDAAVQSQFGYMAQYLTDPEIGPILRDAAQNYPGDQARLQGAIYKTRWWKTHSDSARNFDATAMTDPASSKQAIQNQIALLAGQAKKSGIIIDPKRLASIAVHSLRFNWNPQQVGSALASEGKFDTAAGSPAATTLDQLRQTAAQYLVPVSDKTLQKWVKDVQIGNVGVNDFGSYVKEQAKSLFPGLSGAIDRGVTVEQYADPYRQQAANILEVDPESIDFMHDPKYQKALFQKDPKTGENSAMSLADWGTYLRQQPDYSKTKQANQQAAGFGNQLLQMFGKVAG